MTLLAVCVLLAALGGVFNTISALRLHRRIRKLEERERWR